MSEDKPGEELDNLEEEIPKDSELADEQIDENSDLEDIDSLDKDKLVEELKKNRKELGKSRKSNKEMQSLHDKHYNEGKVETAKLKAQMELLVSQQNRGVSDVQAEKEQESFDNDWIKRMDDEGSKGTIQFVRGTMGDLRKHYEGRISDLEARLDKKISGGLNNVDKYYKDNKVEIDEIVSEYGMDVKKAKEIHRKLVKVKGVLKPKGVQPPGRTSEGGIGPVGGNQPQSGDIDPLMLDVLKNTGKSDAEARKILGGK